MEANGNSLCGLCKKAAAKYTCPRCYVRYCSCECYRNELHVQCSETFYRDCFMEGLQTIDSDDGEKRKMMEMLKRFEKENLSDAEADDDEDLNETLDLAERISGIDLDKNPEEVLRVLSPQELQEFEALLKDSSKCSNMVELSNPWWCDEYPVLMEEIKDGKDVYQSSRLPPRLQGVKEIDKLLKSKKPSDSTAYNIVNVLYGYAYIVRLYNCDHLDVPVECAQLLSRMSLGLLQTQFSDVDTALGGCISCVAGLDRTLFTSHEYSVAIIEDVLKILVGPDALDRLLYALAALSDCHRLFRTSRKAVKIPARSGKQKKDAGQEAQLHSFYLIQKKLEFYVSWVQSYGSELRRLIPEVKLKLCSMSSDLAVVERDKSRIEMLLSEQKSRQGKRLIEEL